MKVAIIAESFLPQANGVVRSLLHVLDHLAERGDEAIVIAPDDPGALPAEVHGARVIGVPSWSLPTYPDVRVASVRTAALVDQLWDFGPDVVHLASPFVLGWKGVRAADHLGLASVAVYQTDVPAFAARYHLPWTHRALSRRVRDIHTRATLTLAPSTAAIETLTALDVPDIRLWRRGVDSDRFDPAHRSNTLRRSLAPNGERLVGFVGRLAPEKQVRDLAALRAVPGTRVVVIGDGPERAKLESLLPEAHFTGMLHGEDLARHVASLDVLVHTGESETFCQVIQEAHASGVPVVATAKGGPRDLVDHSRTGWLYPPGDLAAMADHVRDLVGDEAKRQAFGRAARSSVVLRGWRPVCSELIGHYAAAIEANHVTAPSQGAR